MVLISLIYVYPELLGVKPLYLFGYNPLARIEENESKYRVN